MHSIAALAGLAVGWAAVASAAEPTQAPDVVQVLSTATAWRFHVTYRRPVVGTARRAELAPKPPLRPWQQGGARWVRWGEDLSPPLPHGDWTAVDYDDSGWPRSVGALFGGFGEGRYSEPALICVRARFGVTDPGAVEGMRLALQYRGGAVVYLNGTEIARKHLPAGPISLLSLAEDYPLAAYVAPDGKTVLQRLPYNPPAELLQRFRARIRELTIDVPTRTLRKGTNVLAVELHRTAIRADLPAPLRDPWDTVGLCDLKLSVDPAAARAVQPNTAPPAGLQVWTAEAMLPVGCPVDWGDPFEPLGPIRLLAPRNGVASGQVVVSAKVVLPKLAGQAMPVPFAGLSARVGQLTSDDGSAIRLREANIRYARLPPAEWPDRRHGGDRKKRRRWDFVPLERCPADGEAVQPIWLTVKVPANAHPGVYRGTLTIEGLADPAPVPVELTVYNWTIADPGRWKTCVNLLQSPQSVAGYYKVSLWSDEHFRLLESSLRYMGECGNDVLGVGAVARNVFGNDPLILFRKEDGRYVPDLKFLERYLTLYNRCAGRPQFLSIQVWSYGMYLRGAGRDGGKEEWRSKTMPIGELRGDEVVTVDAPIYGEPGTERQWRAAMDGVCAIVEKLGWGRECILLGTSGDCWVGPLTVAFFRKIAPYARWRAITHGSGVPKWGPTPADRTQPNGMLVGYLELARRISSRRHKSQEVPITCNSRDCTGTDPFQYRALPTVNVGAANFDGFCWKGLDYWTHEGPDGKKRSALNTYVHFGNMVGSTPRTITLPGASGAVATVQYEMLREGIQDCEALILIRDALADDRIRGKLGDELIQQAEEVLADLLALLEAGARYNPHGGGDVRHQVGRLYATAAKVTSAMLRPR